MSEIAFIVETDDGEQHVVLDTDELLGDLTPEEFKLLMGYVEKSGLDKGRGMAGGHLLVQLSRKLDVDHESLLEAVL